MAAEMALAIPPDKSKVPKGLLDQLIGHYGVYRVSNKTMGYLQSSDRRHREARPIQHTSVWTAVTSYYNKGRGAAGPQGSFSGQVTSHLGTGKERPLSSRLLNFGCSSM